MTSLPLSQLLSKPDEISADRAVLVCVPCQKRFQKGSEDYCQICFKLYLPEPDDLSDAHVGKSNVPPFSGEATLTLSNGKPAQEDEDENQMVGSPQLPPRRPSLSLSLCLSVSLSPSLSSCLRFNATNAADGFIVTVKASISFSTQQLPPGHTLFGYS
jgi:hypothetical protein